MSETKTERRSARRVLPANNSPQPPITAPAGASNVPVASQPVNKPQNVPAVKPQQSAAAAKPQQSFTAAKPVIQQPAMKQPGTAPSGQQAVVNPDVSSLRQPIQLGVEGVPQILRCMKSGAREITDVLLYECNIIYECKVCQSLFRGLTNLLAHKRAYCLQSHVDDKLQFMDAPPGGDTVIVQPQAPPTDEWDNYVDSDAESLASVNGNQSECEVIQEIQTVKPSAYRFYTQVLERNARQREEQKVTKVKLSPIAGSAVAMYQQVDMETDSEVEGSGPPVLTRVLPMTTTSAGPSGGEKSKSSGERKSYWCESVKAYVCKYCGVTNPNKQSMNSHMSKHKNEKMSWKKDIDEISFPESDGSRDSHKENVSSGRPPRLEPITDQHVTGQSYVQIEPRSPTTFTFNKKKVKKTASTGKTESSAGSGGKSNKPKVESQATMILKLQSFRQCDVTRLMCIKCNKKLSSRGALLRHMRLLHAKKKTVLKCPLCKNILSRWNNVRRHLMTVHSKSLAQIEKMKPKILAMDAVVEISNELDDSILESDSDINQSTDMSHDADNSFDNEEENGENQPEVEEKKATGASKRKPVGKGDRKPTKAAVKDRPQTSDKPTATKPATSGRTPASASKDLGKPASVNKDPGKPVSRQTPPGDKANSGEKGKGKTVADKLMSRDGTKSKVSTLTLAGRDDKAGDKGVKPAVSDTKGNKSGVSDNKGVKPAVSDTKGNKSGVSDNKGIKSAVSDNKGIKSGTSDNKGVKSAVSDNKAIKSTVSDTKAIKSGVSDNKGFKSGAVITSPQLPVNKTSTPLKDGGAMNVFEIFQRKGKASPASDNKVQTKLTNGDLHKHNTTQNTTSGQKPSSDSPSPKNNNNKTVSPQKHNSGYSSDKDVARLERKLITVASHKRSQSQSNLTLTGLESGREAGREGGQEERVKARVSLPMVQFKSERMRLKQQQALATNDTEDSDSGLAMLGKRKRDGDQSSPGPKCPRPESSEDEVNTRRRAKSPRQETQGSTHSHPVTSQHNTPSNQPNPTNMHPVTSQHNTPSNQPNTKNTQSKHLHIVGNEDEPVCPPSTNQSNASCPDVEDVNKSPHIEDIVNQTAPSVQIRLVNCKSKKKLDLDSGKVVVTVTEPPDKKREKEKQRLTAFEASVASIQGLSRQDRRKIASLVNEDTLTCLKCGASFRSNSNLHRHAVRHLGWRRFQCVLCPSVTFYHRSECRRHINKIHIPKMAAVLDPDPDYYIRELEADKIKTQTISMPRVEIPGGQGGRQGERRDSGGSSQDYNISTRRTARVFDTAPFIRPEADLVVLDDEAESEGSLTEHVQGRVKTPQKSTGVETKRVGSQSVSASPAKSPRSERPLLLKRGGPPGGQASLVERLGQYILPTPAQSDRPLTMASQSPLIQHQPHRATAHTTAIQPRAHTTEDRVTLQNPDGSVFADVPLSSIQQGQAIGGGGGDIVFLLVDDSNSVTVSNSPASHGPKGNPALPRVRPKHRSHPPHSATIVRPEQIASDNRDPHGGSTAEPAVSKLPSHGRSEPSSVTDSRALLHSVTTAMCESPLEDQEVAMATRMFPQVAHNQPTPQQPQKTEENRLVISAAYSLAAIQTGEADIGAILPLEPLASPTTPDPAVSPPLTTDQVCLVTGDDLLQMIHDDQSHGEMA